MSLRPVRVWVSTAFGKQQEIRCYTHLGAQRRCRDKLENERTRASVSVGFYYVHQTFQLYGLDTTRCWPFTHYYLTMKWSGRRTYESIADLVDLRLFVLSPELMKPRMRQIPPYHATCVHRQHVHCSGSSSPIPGTAFYYSTTPLSNVSLTPSKRYSFVLILGYQLSITSKHDMNNVLAHFFHSMP